MRGASVWLLPALASCQVAWPPDTTLFTSGYMPQVILARLKQQMCLVSPQSGPNISAVVGMQQSVVDMLGGLAPNATVALDLSDSSLQCFCAAEFTSTNSRDIGSIGQVLVAYYNIHEAQSAYHASFSYGDGPEQQKEQAAYTDKLAALSESMTSDVGEAFNALLSSSLLCSPKCQVAMGKWLSVLGNALLGDLLFTYASQSERSSNAALRQAKADQSNLILSSFLPETDQRLFDAAVNSAVNCLCGGNIDVARLWSVVIEIMPMLFSSSLSLPPSAPPTPPPAPQRCTNTCQSHVGLCDDGGPGHVFSDCVFGTNCVDCGPRYAEPPAPFMSNSTFQVFADMLRYLSSPSGACSGSCAKLMQQSAQLAVKVVYLLSVSERESLTSEFFNENLPWYSSSFFNLTVLADPSAEPLIEQTSSAFISCFCSPAIDWELLIAELRAINLGDAPFMAAYRSRPYAAVAVPIALTAHLIESAGACASASCRQLADAQNELNELLFLPGLRPPNKVCTLDSFTQPISRLASDLYGYQCTRDVVFTSVDRGGHAFDLLDIIGGDKEFLLSSSSQESDPSKGLAFTSMNKSLECGVLWEVGCAARLTCPSAGASLYHLHFSTLHMNATIESFAPRVGEFKAALVDYLAEWAAPVLPGSISVSLVPGSVVTHFNITTRSELVARRIQAAVVSMNRSEASSFLGVMHPDSISEVTVGVSQGASIEDSCFAILAANGTNGTSPPGCRMKATMPVPDPIVAVLVALSAIGGATLICAIAGLVFRRRVLRWFRDGGKTKLISDAGNAQASAKLDALRGMQLNVLSRKARPSGSFAPPTGEGTSVAVGGGHAVSEARVASPADVLGVSSSMLRVLEEQLRHERSWTDRGEPDESVETDDKFSVRQLVFGRMADSARGIEHFIGVTDEQIAAWRLDGIEAIRREFEMLRDTVKAKEAPHSTRAAADVACECMRYVLDEEAGASPLMFPNSPHPRDCGPGGVLPERMAPSGRGKRLADFANSPEAQQAGLTILHVAALRIYSTAAFCAINEPLRDLGRKERQERHPLPLTTALLSAAVSKLRAVGAEGAHANEAVHLYRGLRNAEISGQFEKAGGTELGAMSTTDDLGVALRYCGRQSARSVLLQLRTRSAMERGADICWCSCFPHERENLYPPLIYLQPVRREAITLAGRDVTVLVVEPRA